MKITQRLIGYLHRVFNKDPAPFIGLTVACNGTGLAWAITDGPAPGIGFDDGITHWDDVGIDWDDIVETTPGTTSFLTLTPVGGSASVLVIDLARYTVSGLATFIATKTGYTVPYVDGTALSNLSALVLLNGAGADGILRGYTSLVWAYMDAQAEEIETAQTQIGNMLQQMSTTTAGDIWLDLLGSYYGIPRILGEFDAQYGPRIISTAVRPLGNNVAMESALRAINGGLAVTVVDYPTLTNNSYGLFDVNFALSLAMLAVHTPTDWTTAITNIIQGMRDAGTFLRVINLITPIQGTEYVGGTFYSGGTTYVHP